MAPTHSLTARPTPGHGETTAPVNTAVSPSQRGYDPEEMAWSTISLAGEDVSAAAEPLRNENLFRLVERRSQRRKDKMAAATAQDAPGKQLSKQQAPASRREKEPAKPAWKPKPLPKFHPDDFVVVLKPRSAVELGAIFQPGELGLSLRTYLGAQLAADFSFVLSREQNLILASTQNAYVADRILGDFVINSAKGDVPLRGHLKQGDEEVSYGVVSIANHETSETLKGSIQWRQGTILDIRKFGTSNRARLTFAGKVKPRTVLYNSEIITVRPYLRTIPACGLCGTVGHRADTCPNPNQDRCGLCGQHAPFVEGMRAPHECNAKCAVCGGGHATNSRDCAAKYRTLTKLDARKGKNKNPAGKPAKRQPAHITGSSGDSPRRSDVNSTRAAPSGRAEKQGAAAPPPPPHGGQGNPSRSQQQQTKRQSPGNSWADIVKHGKEGSTSTGASTSTSPPSSPSRSAADSELLNLVASLKAQNEMLLAKIEAIENQSTPPPQSSPHAEVMESEAAAPATLESSINALETRLETKFADMMSELGSQLLSKITKQFHAQINAQVAEALPNMLARAARKGNLKDISGRPSKFSRRLIILDDEEDSSSLSGTEVQASELAPELQPTQS